jgi:hypothetical protein
MPLVQFIGFGRFFRGEGDSFIRSNEDITQIFKLVSTSRLWV